MASLAKFPELVSQLHCCSYVSDITEHKGLLAAQILPLFEESLFSQQAFAPSYAKAIAACLLLCTGYTRPQLPCFATDIGQQKQLIPMLSAA